MPEPKTRRVLLCGGHLDGQWVDVPEGHYTYRVPKPVPVLSDPGTDLRVPVPEFVQYHLEPITLYVGGAGGRLWIGVWDWGLDRDKAVLRALFQRDVAQQLLGGRRADA